MQRITCWRIAVEGEKLSPPYGFIAYNAFLRTQSWITRTRVGGGLSEWFKEPKKLITDVALEGSALTSQESSVWCIEAPRMRIQ